MSRSYHSSLHRLTFTILLLLTFAGAASFPLPFADARTISTSAQVSEPWLSAPPIVESTAAIMQRAQARTEPFTLPLRRPNRPDRLHNPQSPAVANWPAVAPQLLRAPNARAPQTPDSNLNFLGAIYEDSFSFPPDTMGTVGPSQYIVLINGRLRSFNKTTGLADGVLDIDPDFFFDSVTAGFRTGDPRIHYDRSTKRWFLTSFNVPANYINNRVLIAVSDAASNGIISNGTIWRFYFVPSGVATVGIDQFVDYPTLGVDSQALYIGASLFDPDFYSGSVGYIVRKSTLLEGTPAVVTGIGFEAPVGNPVPFISTPQGAVNFDTNPQFGYFIGDSNYDLGVLRIVRISDPAGTPSVTEFNLTVPATQRPINVRHQGNTIGVPGFLDGIDTRLMMAVIRNGRLWTTHGVGVNSTGASPFTQGAVTRIGARWYEIGTLSTTPELVQSGTVFDPTGPNDLDQLNYWMPSIMVSGQGHVAMGFSVAGTNSFINAATIGRLKTDPPGTMQGTPVRYTNAVDAYNPASNSNINGTYRRWGDYSYTSLDPEDDMTMWTIQEYTAGSANGGQWGVRVVRLNAPPPATIASAAPALIASGSTVDIEIQGTSMNGSGFFDPGAGFARRLNASVSETGVTVNSVSYLNPTTLVLKLSVALDAPQGSRDLTITNPDGQSTTACALIQIGVPSEASTATTCAASNVLGKTATLNASVNAGGGSAAVTFELTTVSGDYSNPIIVTATGSPISGSAPVAVVGQASGLSPSTTYFFRVVATNSTGTATGVERSFTTSDVVEYFIYLPQTLKP